MSDLIDYDDICEFAGTKVQQGDGLVKEAVQKCAPCKTLKAVIKLAEQERSRCVREEKFFTAWVYDCIIQRAEQELRRAKELAEEFNIGPTDRVNTDTGEITRPK